MSPLPFLTISLEMLDKYHNPIHNIIYKYNDVGRYAIINKAFIAFINRIYASNLVI